MPISGRVQERIQVQIWQENVAVSIRSLVSEVPGRLTEKTQNPSGHSSSDYRPRLRGMPGGRGSQLTVFHFENPIENVQSSLVVRHDNDPGLLLVGDHAE